MKQAEHPAGKKIGIARLVWSLVAAFCGIQNQENHDRDTSHLEEVGFLPYIITGVVLTVLFVLTVYLVVQIILRLAGI